MTDPIPPATTLPAGLGSLPDPAPAAAGLAPAAAAATAPAAPTSVPASVPTAIPIPTAAPATSVQWSAQALQELRLQAFEQLVAQLALQVQAQARSLPLPPAWPAQGISAPLQQWVQGLLAQIGVQGQPLQLLAAQPGSAALIEALARAVAAQQQQPQSAAAAAGHAAAAFALRTAAALSPTMAAALQASPAAAPAAAAQPAPAMQAMARPIPPAPPMPPLQNWWVQQGTLLTPQGERGFSLTLQVPVAWAQSMGAPVPAAGLPPGAGSQPQAAAQPLRLPWPGNTPLPASGPIALVLQPRDNPAAAPTSALLWLEFQPAPAASATAMAAGAAGLALSMPAPALAQEVQQLLQNKSDPWLMMAAAQAANAVPSERRPLGEHRSHLCTTEGCQYQGRAPCAQPFCSEMNRIWTTTRLEKSQL